MLWSFLKWIVVPYMALALLGGATVLVLGIGNPWMAGLVGLLIGGIGGVPFARKFLKETRDAY